MSSLSISLPILARLLPKGDLGFYLYLYLFCCDCIFNSLKICAQILACIRSVPACSILGGCVHKFLVFMTHEEVFGVWSTRENKFTNGCVGDPQGSHLGDFDLRGSLWWCVIYWGKITHSGVWWWFWPARKSLMVRSSQGKFLFLLYDSLENLCCLHS